MYFLILYVYGRYFWCIGWWWVYWDEWCVWLEVWCYDNSIISENVYYGNDVGDVYLNELIKENLILKCLNVCNFREDEIYEKIEC